MDLDPSEMALMNTLCSLQKKLSQQTYKKYKRINPFFEDLCDWKERGQFWANESNVTIYNSVTICGDVNIGNNTWIGSYVNLDGTGGLFIGEFCSIASGAQLLSHDTVAWALTGGKSKYTYSPTTIGDRCFIGTHAVITKGVVIGNESIVCAGAVVTKSFPSNSILAGVPAKKIGETVVCPQTFDLKCVYSSLKA